MTNDFSLPGDIDESISNISSNELFGDLMNIKNIKQEQISTNPFLENEVNNLQNYNSNYVCQKYI